MGTVPDCRQSIIDTLKLLSSPERQLAYERNVPGISATNELLSAWFDDTYLPESKTFMQSFSTQELEVMADFDRYFEERSNFLPMPHEGVSDWLRDENWRGIMQRATDLLNMLAPQTFPERRTSSAHD